MKQFPAKKQASIAVEGKSWTVPSIGMEMMWCEPGTFMMGSPESEVGRREHDETQHEVTLTEGFYLGKYEVTQEEYEKVMGGNPSIFKGKKLPVEMVNWNDAMEFCKRLTELEKDEWVSKGWNYVLPTEAQWEYACRAGTFTVYSWSDTISPELQMGWRTDLVV